MLANTEGSGLQLQVLGHYPTDVPFFPQVPCIWPGLGSVHQQKQVECCCASSRHKALKGLVAPTFAVWGALCHHIRGLVTLTGRGYLEGRGPGP